MSLLQTLWGLLLWVLYPLWLLAGAIDYVCHRRTNIEHTSGATESLLHLAQFAALLLSLTAGSYIGFAVAHEAQTGVGFDIAFAVGFLVVAASTLITDPRQALTVLALAFAAHAVIDVAHRPGLLPDGIAPRWYLIGCATYDVYIGALCYLPILRR